MTDVDDAASSRVPTAVAAEQAALEQEFIEPAEAGAAAADPPPRDLGRATARGAVVTLGGQGSQILLQMTLVVVLARLLSPHDYGLYAMILVICGIGEVFRDFGLSSAAVQARSLSDGQRDNLFWLNAGLGLVLSAVLFSAAPLVADLFGEPRLVPIARVLCVTFLINGLGTQYRAGLNRAMRFGALAATDLVAQLVNVTVAIGLAIAGAGYWALVASQIAQVSAVLVLLVVLSKWIPGRPRRDAPVGGFLRFGINFVATQLINYAANNVDTVTIGIRFGAGPLGFYNRAYQLLMNPLGQLRKPATTVALPVLSRLQDDPKQANAYIVRGQLLLGYTIVLGLAYGAGAAAPVVGLFLGSDWVSSAFIFSMLAIAGTFQMMSYVGYWIYLSRGLTNHLLRYTIWSFVLRVVCITVGSEWGIRGVAIGFAIAPALGWPISLWWLSRAAVIPRTELYQGAARILSVSALLGATSYAVCQVLADSIDVVQIGASLAASVAVLAVVAASVPIVRTDLGSIGLVVGKLRRRR